MTNKLKIFQNHTVVGIGYMYTIRSRPPHACYSFPFKYYFYFIFKNRSEVYRLSVLSDDPCHQAVVMIDDEKGPCTGSVMVGGR